MLDPQLCRDSCSEGDKILRILPADTHDPPSSVRQIVLTSEPLSGVVAYFLLVVAELRAAVRFDDDLQIRKNNIPEIGAVVDSDRELCEYAPRVQAFDDPQYRGLENVIATSIGCFDDCLSTQVTVVAGETREFIEHHAPSLLTPMSRFIESKSVEMREGMHHHACSNERLTRLLVEGETNAGINGRFCFEAANVDDATRWHTPTDDRGARHDRFLVVYRGERAKMENRLARPCLDARIR